MGLILRDINSVNIFHVSLPYIRFLLPFLFFPSKSSSHSFFFSTSSSISPPSPTSAIGISNLFGSLRKEEFEEGGLRDLFFRTKISRLVNKVTGPSSSAPRRRLLPRYPLALALSPSSATSLSSIPSSTPTLLPYRHGPVFKLQLDGKLYIMVFSLSAARAVLKNNDLIFANWDVSVAGRCTTYGGHNIV